MLRTAILHECQNYLGGGGGGGGGLGGSEKNIFLAPPSLPPPTSYKSPTPATSVHLKINIPVTVRRNIYKQSHEKIGDCQQSSFVPEKTGRDTLAY